MRGKRSNIYDTVKIPRGLTNQIEELMDDSEGNFTSRTDVIKHCVRKYYEATKWKKK